MRELDESSAEEGKSPPRAPSRSRRTAWRRGQPPHRVRRRPGNYVKVLPNLITSASFFLALFAIVKSAEGIVVATQGLSPEPEFIAACWAILLAAVCDAIDGPVARLTRSASDFGLQYDSLADMTAFGLAPAFLMFARLRTMDPSMLPDYAPRLALGACSLYAICAAIRLARFNTQAMTTEKSSFLGLPSPGAAGTVVSAYLFVEWLVAKTGSATEDGLDLTRLLHRSLLLLMVGLAVLMVSELRFPKLRFLVSMPRNPINALVSVIALACVMIAFDEYLPLLIFTLFMVYLVGSIMMSFSPSSQRSADTETQD